MSITITLPQKIEAQLERKANAQQLSVERIVLEILSSALEAEEFPTPEMVAAKIQATPPNPNNIRPAKGDLAEALRTAPEDPDFDLAAWRQAWAAVKTEMEAMTHANDAEEGRG